MDKNKAKDIVYPIAFPALTNVNIFFTSGDFANSEFNSLATFLYCD